MFSHILVTLDGTPSAEAVLPHAVDIARSMGAEITLMRVVEAVNSDWSERGALGKGQTETTIRSVFADQAEAYLQRVAAQLAESGVKASAVVRHGAPARQIVDAARDVDADAIAMATHSRRGLNRLMFGSVAEAVLHQSSLPVLLIRSAA
jgi:nucleotide-binding universal stress UspA family protein